MADAVAACRHRFSSSRRPPDDGGTTTPSTPTSFAQRCEALIRFSQQPPSCSGNCVNPKITLLALWRLSELDLSLHGHTFK
jgi:hypothetical protein